MIVSRKGFYFNVPPGDRQLWAIGMVVVQWSALENLLTGVANGILANDENARKIYEETRVTKLRLDMLHTHVDQRVVDPARERLIGIIGRAKEMQAERDKIVHGAWTAPFEDEPEHASAFSFGGARRPFEWKLTFGRLVEIARKIDKLQADLLQIIMSFKPKDEPGGFAMRSALQQTLHEQYRLG